jgi:hypothetical protein
MKFRPQLPRAPRRTKPKVNESQASATAPPRRGTARRTKKAVDIPEDPIDNYDEDDISLEFPSHIGTAPRAGPSTAVRQAASKPPARQTAAPPPPAARRVALPPPPACVPAMRETSVLYIGDSDSEVIEIDESPYPRISPGPPPPTREEIMEQCREVLMEKRDIVSLYLDDT